MSAPRVVPVLAALAAFVIGPVHARQTPTPPAAQTRQISGRVIDADSSVAVAGAQVTLRGSALGFGWSGQTNSRVAQTDLAGDFVFDDVPAGMYTVVAIGSGYLGGQYGQTAPSSIGAPLDVTATGVRRLTLRMWREASLAGTVRSEKGDPLRDVTVRAMRWQTVGGQRRLVNRGTAKTSAAGSYAILGLPAGEYVLWVPSIQITSPGQDAVASPFQLISDISMTTLFSLLSASTPLMIDGLMFTNYGAPLPASATRERLVVYRSKFWPAADAPEFATSVRLAPGQNQTDIDVRLDPSETTRVSGHVVGDVEDPDKLMIRLEPGGSSTLSPSTLSHTAIAAVNSRGEFTFAGVPSGQYTLRVIFDPPPSLGDGSKGFSIFVGLDAPMSIVTGDGLVMPMPVPSEPMRWASLPVFVDDRPISDLAVVVRNGVRVSGKLVVDAGVSAPNSDVWRQVEIAFEPKADRTSVFGPRGIVDASGALRSASMEPGDYVIRARAAPRGFVVKSVLLGGRDVTETAVTIDRDRADLVLTLTDRPTHVVGLVTTRLGLPDPDATVVVFPTDVRLWTDYGEHPGRLRSSRTNALGEFMLEGLPPGEYFVAAIHESSIDDWQDREVLQRMAAQAAKVRLGEGSAVSVTPKLFERPR